MIEFQYFDGCPNAEGTLVNLKSLIAKELSGFELSITEIKDISEAEQKNFQGSPTILVDGIDIYTGEVPDSYNYTCRIYNLNGKMTGILTRDYIYSRIALLGKD